MKKCNHGAFPIALRNCVEYFKKGRSWALLEQGVAVFRALSWVAGIIATQKLFEVITNAQKGEHNYYQIAVRLGILAIILIGQQILSGTGQYLLSKVSYTNMGKFMAEFQRKLGRLPAKTFEDAEFLNNLNKAKECLEYESLGHFASICLQLFTYYLVYFISIGGYLFWLSPILPLVILLAFLPAILGQLSYVKVFAALEEENAPLRRQCEYYKKAIGAREYFKETRLLGAFRYFQCLFASNLLCITEKTWKTECKASILRLFLSIVSFVGLGASIAILFNATMVGEISIGAFVSVFVAISQIFSIMDEVVSTHLSEGSEILGQVANYYRLLDMVEVGGEYGSLDFAKGIAAKEVSFAYPGGNELAVRNITLTIKDGETIAIVGENGSGKSTLVRLLIGLYTPVFGTVEIGGLNSKTIEPNHIYKGISGVFQNYQRYKMTLAENVAISDMGKPINPDKILRNLQEAEFNEDSATLDTMLSPEFDGIDLSGGQWQRLAIARGLYRTNNFIVLDEPTAAIDPIEEARLYNQFRRLVQGKCAIIVTHRLGSVRLANRIVVMDNGVISDIGTHEELIARQGKYSDMWKAQVAWYEDRIT